MGVRARLAAVRPPLRWDSSEIFTAFWTRSKVKMDGEDWGVRASTKGSSPLLHPLRARQNSLRIQGTLLPIPHPREEGHDCRRTGSHRWKATTRRFGHPTRTIYHRHDMRALMEQPDTEYHRHTTAVTPQRRFQGAS